ncbi:TPA: hypothetical protein DCK82_03805 [Candidatus Beckwithbacteria bacterium]|nr:hypothetical protein [Candidatus Beckwithbacteria bacterium]
MPLSLPQVQEIVLKSGKVSPEDLNEAVKTAKHLEVPLEEVLVGRRLISPEELGGLLAEAYRISYLDLKTLELNREVLKLVAEEFAESHHVVPVEVRDNVVTLAMEDPSDLEAIEFVKKQTGYGVMPAFTDKAGMSQALRLYKGTLKEEFAELVEKTTVKRVDVNRPLVELAKDVSVVKAVDALLSSAVVEQASDIHLEPLGNEVVVRYRIDGVLNDVLILPSELHPALVARIKILANLKLDETRLPQDGRMQFLSKKGDKVSLRVSVLPTVEGEKVVLRILEEVLQHFSLNSLGLEADQEKRVARSINKPHGMVLVTGPTGSGKTTTLYTILGMLNTVGVNICTVEDPVENRIRRVNQTQVNPQAGYSFATGLRSLLRQDPDIIMVGEIRDQETAKIAVNAAMTGHLVLSTLHTNDAPGTVPRLLDLSVESFLLASTLELVVAQRLIRKVCKHCLVEYAPQKNWEETLKQVVNDEAELTEVLTLFPKKLIGGKGCPKCRYSGYRGRMGIFEVMGVSEAMMELIVKQKSGAELRRVARAEGMKSMLMAGMMKVASGVTTVEEVLRVSLE